VGGFIAFGTIDRAEEAARLSMSYPPDDLAQRAASVACNRPNKGKPPFRARHPPLALPFWSVQFCTDSAPADGRNMTMDEISFHRLKAERCARLAKEEPDTHRKVELGTEGALWLELADAEERLAEVRKKVQSRLNAHHLNGVAFAREPSRQGNPIKGLDLDDPEARQQFIQGE
jgi:hypothetical protein